MSEHHETHHQPRELALAVAQVVLRDDPGDADGLRASGREIRRLMAEAQSAGARLVHFPEGATCSPAKRKVSSDPDRVAAADWSKADWAVHQEEVESIATLAGELGLWVVLGAVHRLSAPHRPHNSMYVISDAGRVVTRYDERMLSATKVEFMYAPGSAPVTFEVDGFRFGCALGMEVHFPELWTAYERLDVDAVLFSTAGPGGGAGAESWAVQAQGHASANSFWVSYAGSAQQAAEAPSGIVTPEGAWAARCGTEGVPALAIARLSADESNLARPWRRRARSGIYADHLVVGDPRSEDRALL